MKRRDSIKHVGLLSGLTITGASGILGGCWSHQLNYTPVFLSRAEDHMVSQLVDLIIPATTTPGALEVGVNQFIDVMMARWASEEEQQIFRSGLSELDRIAIERYDDEFVDCERDQKIELLQTLQTKSHITEHNFFKQIKMLTVYGYYTSEVGATRELEYVHAAGEWKADIPYSDIGKAYS